MPNPCKGCKKQECTGTDCLQWRADFLRRWQRISNFAAALRRPSTGIQDPCGTCPSYEYCTVWCPAKASQWDTTVAILRKKMWGEL